jgi:hypothetical protein
LSICSTNSVSETFYTIFIKNLMRLGDFLFYIPSRGDT